MIPGKIYVAAIAAGILEFLVVGILFLMACFALVSTDMSLQVVSWGFSFGATQIEVLILGITALFGFLVGLGGSVSALERKRWRFSIFATAFTAFWGILLCFYTLLLMPDDSVTMTIGYIVILLSAVSSLLLFISRAAFRRHAF